MTKNYLYARSIPVGKTKISIHVPTVREIIESEEIYYNHISAVLASPIDYMVQLDDKGIDFERLNSFELFLMFFEGFKTEDLSLIFEGLDLNNFEFAINEQNGMLVLLDRKNDITIDRAVHEEICIELRKINHLEKDIRKPGNEEAKKYMIERARKKQRNAARKQKKSQLEELIIALVNTEQFKYGYEEVLDLTIYQFNASVYQIIKKINYDNTMIGCYAGTINAKELSQNQLNWLTSK